MVRRTVIVIATLLLIGWDAPILYNHIGTGLVAPVTAQEVTSVRFYIVPKVGTGAHDDEFRAKYIDDDPAVYPGGTGVIVGLRSMMDYGLEPIFAVGANVTAAEDAIISAQPDVIAIPAGSLDNLPTTLGLSTLKANLESLKIPTGWVNATHSYRDILRFVVALFQIFQRYHGLTGQTLFTAGVTLDSTIGQLSAAQKSALQQAASDLGVSTAGINNGTTIRAALRIIAPQLPNITLAGVAI